MLEFVLNEVCKTNLILGPPTLRSLRRPPLRIPLFILGANRVVINNNQDGLLKFYGLPGRVVRVHE